jgi:hypothetical protein
MQIIDEADEEDLDVHGRVELEPTDTGTIEELENKTIEELKKHYEWLFKECPGLKISLNETNFKERWIEFSLEGDDLATRLWKRDQGVGLIPTPESRVGADIY